MIAFAYKEIGPDGGPSESGINYRALLHVDDIAARFLKSVFFRGDTSVKARGETLHVDLKPTVPHDEGLLGKDYRKWLMDAQIELGYELAYAHARNKTLQYHDQYLHKKITEDLQIMIRDSVTNFEDIGHEKSPAGFELLDRIVMWSMANNYKMLISAKRFKPDQSHRFGVPFDYRQRTYRDLEINMEFVLRAPECLDSPTVVEKLIKYEDVQEFAASDVSTENISLTNLVDSDGCLLSEERVREIQRCCICFRQALEIFKTVTQAEMQKDSCPDFEAEGVIADAIDKATPCALFNWVVQ